MGTDPRARSKRRSTATLALATALILATSIGVPSTRAATGLAPPMISVWGAGCLVTDTGTPACWGEFNNPDVGPIHIPPTPPPGQFRLIQAGSGFMCGLKMDDSLACFGDLSTVLQAPSGTFRDVDAGHDKACVIDEDGEASCWDDYLDGEPFVEPPAPGPFEAVTVASTHACGLQANGDLKCWGPSQFGEAPDSLAGDFVSVDAGLGFTCTLDSAGAIGCFGDSNEGVFDGFSAAGPFVQIATGERHLCAIKTDGTLACWGHFPKGPLVPPPGQFVALGVGDRQACAIRIDDAVICWGVPPDHPGLPEMQSDPPPPAILDRPYSWQFHPLLQYPAQTVEVAEGSLPPGLTLTTDGLLSGTPTTTGSWPLTVQASNGIGPVITQTFDLVVNAIPVFRIAGLDRYATSVQATAHWIPGITNVIVASGENYPDGLAAGASAGGHHLAMLLVRRNSIPAVVAAELDRLDPLTIYVVGGPASVSPAVENALRAYASSGVVRLAGADRYGTAVAVSQQFGLQGTVYVAAGMSFPDALAGAAAAGAHHAPLLLVPRDVLPAAVRQEILRLSTTKIIILGGTGVVSAQVEAALRQLAPSVTRIAGADRYETAVKLSSTTWGAGNHHVFIASGTTFPDALVGGAYAGERDAPLLLVPATHMPANVAAEILRLGVDDATIFGGTGVVSQAVENALLDLVAWD
jgi:putative cell wall-binding protein